MREGQQDAATRAGAHFEDTGRRTDEALLGGLFAKQGAKSVPVTASFRAEYMAAARSARANVGDKYVPSQLMQRVMQMLADYRVEHQQQR